MLMDNQRDNLLVTIARPWTDTVPTSHFMNTKQIFN